ncbi:MAG: NifB/NifX family molybdenum-iron cluster-binding protein [Desulfovibrionales bacterium]
MNSKDNTLSLRPFVAVATKEGMLVNQHLGEAAVFQIWDRRHGGFSMVEERTAPSPGDPRRWPDLAELLSDCRAVLVSAVGATPQAILEEQNIQPVVMDGFIEEGLKAVYHAEDLSRLRPRRKKACCSAEKFGNAGEGCG